MRTARILTVRFPILIAPPGSLRKVRYHPSGLRVQDRTKTRPATTTIQMAMKRWTVPARIRRYWLSLNARRTGAGNLLADMAGGTNSMTRRDDNRGWSTQDVTISERADGATRDSPKLCNTKFP